MEVVKKLVQASSDINARNKEHNTPLHEACFKSRETVVEYLIKSGVDINIHNSRRQTALDCAKNSKIIQMLKNPEMCK